MSLKSTIEVLRNAEGRSEILGYNSDGYFEIEARFLLTNFDGSNNHPVIVTVKGPDGERQVDLKDAVVFIDKRVFNRRHLESQGKT